MKKNKELVRMSAQQVKNMVNRGQDQTDWKRLDQLTDDQIEASIDVTEEGQPDWLHAATVLPSGKQQLTVRFDIDVVEWFRAQGNGYQTRMNQVLRRYVEAQQDR